MSCMLPDPEHVDQHVQMDTLLIIRLQNVCKDVRQLNHFIMRIYLQGHVSKYVLVKVLHIILIKLVYIVL